MPIELSTVKQMSKTWLASALRAHPGAYSFIMRADLFDGFIATVHKRLSQFIVYFESIKKPMTREQTTRFIEDMSEIYLRCTLGKSEYAKLMVREAMHHERG